MTAITGEPFRGLAMVSVENDTAPNDNWRRYTVSITDVTPANLDAGGDQADWVYDPASAGEIIAVTLRLEWDIEGVPLVSAADTVSVQVRLKNGGAQVGSAWAPAISGNTGSATTTLRFDDNPLDASAGTVRWGELELFVQVSRAAAVAWGPADSRGTYSSPAAATHNDWARGYIKRTARLTGHSVSNVAIAGAEPSSFAWHDPVHVRATLDAQAYENATLNCRIRDTGANVRTKALAGAGPNFDYSFTGAGEPIDNDFDNDSDDLRFDFDAADFGGDNAFTWAASGHQTGFAVTSELILDDSARIPVAPDLTLGTVTLSQSVHNRGESATVSFGVTNGRNEAVTESLSFQIKDSGGTVKKSFSDTGATYGDGGTSDYTIGATDKATYDLVGDQWTLNGNVADATFTNTRNVYKVSRMWTMSVNDAAPAEASVWTGTGASPSSDVKTVFNRGQQCFFHTHVFNARGEHLANSTINFNVRPVGSETYDETANDTETLVTMGGTTGHFGHGGAKYTVDTDEAVGGKALVIASSSTTAGANQPRTGTAGDGNFAESNLVTPEWTVSATYTVLTRTQKESSRNADAMDTQFTIGEDVVYEFANVLDASGAAVDWTGTMSQVNPSGSTTQSFAATGTAAAGGWNADPGQAFDSRAPAGAGWVQRTTLLGADNQGNSGSDDQAISMLSAFTANKNICVFVMPYNAEDRHIRSGDALRIIVTYLVSGARVAADVGGVKISITKKVANDSTHVLQADGTFADTGLVEFDCTAAAQTGVYVCSFGPGTEHVMDMANFTAGRYMIIVGLTKSGQEFRDDEDFEIFEAINEHNASALDAVDFALNGNVSFK